LPDGTDHQDEPVFCFNQLAHKTHIWRASQRLNPLVGVSEQASLQVTHWRTRTRLGTYNVCSIAPT